MTTSEMTKIDKFATVFVCIIALKSSGAILSLFVGSKLSPFEWFDLVTTIIIVLYFVWWRYEKPKVKSSDTA